MIWKLIWRIFRKQLIANYVKSQNKPLLFSELEIAFTDTNGKNYYRMPKHMALPVMRFAKLQEFIMWMSAGLSGAELDQLLEVQEVALGAGLTSAKNAAKIGYVIQQIKERRAMVVHTELLINYLAVQWIREDEIPEVYDNEIQMQKVERFKKDIADLPGFFFRVPELKVLYNFQAMSESEWTKFWRDSELEQRILTEQIKIYQSKTGLSNTGSNEEKR